MSLLAAGLKTRLQASTGPFGWLLKIVTPNDEILRYSDSPYSSAAEGHYDARVVSWGPINRVISDRSGQMTALETRVQIADTDREWAQLAEGATGEDLAGSTATIRLAHPELAAADWSTQFTGILDSWSYPSPLVVELVLRTNDIELRRSIPRAGWKIAPSVWTDAPSASYNLYAPLLYGSWSADDYTQTGSVPCIYIDTVGFRYLVCAGRAKAVNRVYVDGVLAASGWTATYVTAGGRLWTLIDFNSDQGDGDVTADVDGYEDVGDGTGTLIATPTGGLAHYLSNFVFDDHKGVEDWTATSSRIDSTSLTTMASYFAMRGYVIARRIADAGDPYQEVANFLQTTETRAYWTASGTIGLSVEDVSGDPYAGNLESFDGAALAVEADSEQLLTSVIENYLQNDNEGRFLRSITVQDPRQTPAAEETIDQLWGPAA